MYRWAWAVLVMAAAVGCGKSFQEADAIYKDEVAKLEQLEQEREREIISVSRQSYGKDPEAARPKFDKINSRYKPLIEAQRKAVAKWSELREQAKQ